MSEISTLFQKPPLEWTAADLELAVAYFKEHRGNFHLIKKDGAIKRKRSRKAKAKPDLGIKETSP
jgi:hypothetical protein